MRAALAAAAAAQDSLLAGQEAGASSSSSTSGSGGPRARTGDGVPGLPADNTLSKRCVKAAGTAMAAAARVLSTQAHLLKLSFPPGISMPDLVAQARSNKGLDGAQEVLTFLTKHITK